MLRIEIIDLGINNISSVVRAFNESSEEEVRVLEQGAESESPDLLVLPGLGYFEKGINSMDERGFRPILLEAASNGIPISGICLGMQLLGEYSEESPGSKGLGLISGGCKKFPITTGERIPNTGWNSTSLRKMESEFPSLKGTSDFYFVHSYYFEPKYDEDILSETKYGETKYPSSIIRETTIGFQFHPEKSAQAGKRMLSDLISWASSEI